MSNSCDYTFEARLQSLRATKLKHTEEKRRVIGSMDMDDHGVMLPNPEQRKVVRVISGSGVPITDVLFKPFAPVPNHPSGGFFGARSCGANYRRLLELHPACVDPMSALAGGYMASFLSYRQPAWNPDFAYPHLQPEIDKYKLTPGIGAVQHFCQDLAIGLRLGWKGLLDKIEAHRRINKDEEAAELYDGLRDIILGIQNWIGRNAAQARQMAATEDHPPIRRNLEEIAGINEHLVQGAPRTFRQAVQWMHWYQLASKMYNMSGSLGRIDMVLWPFYEKDMAGGSLDREEAIFLIACHLLHDTSYSQLGGPDEAGGDCANELSFLVLEAAHRLKIPANIGVCVGERLDDKLLRRGVEILFEDKTGIPKFLGVENTSAGFARNGFPMSVARQRAYSGCHWSALPGREYTVNDCVKVNFAAVFEVALKDMMAQGDSAPSAGRLWDFFEKHLRRAVEVIAACLDFHIDHMYRVFPELMLDLLCHGPIEKGRDASHGGVEFVNLCIDGASLATVADSFAAVEQRIDREGQMSWPRLMQCLEADWAGADGERTRQMMRNIPRYGSSDSLADDYAGRISGAFTRAVKEKPTPAGHNLIPGIFSWAVHIAMGKDVGATPNGRHAFAPLSHGPNPDAGFRKDGAPTALALAVAKTQCGWGNSNPMQMDLDPGIGRDEGGVEKVVSLIQTHFKLGGTQINLNVVDRARLLEAHKDPSKYPDLVVRVTGFSAYFASLSPEFRQMIIDRILRE